MRGLRQELTRLAMFKHRSLRASLPAYVDGTLNAPDRARLILHLYGCQECVARIQELRRLERLLTDGPAMPAVSFGQFWLPLRERIRAGHGPGPRRSPRLQRIALAFAIAVVASSFGVFMVFALEGGRISLPGGGIIAGPSPSASPTGLSTSASPITSGSSPARPSASPNPATTAKAQATATPVASPSRQPSESASPSPSASESATASPSPSASESPSPSPSPSPSESASASPSPSPPPSSDSHGGSASPSPSASTSS
jgi:putative zinc finger protein